MDTRLRHGLWIITSIMCGYVWLYCSLPDSGRSGQEQPTVCTTSDWSRGRIRQDGWLSCICSAQLFLSGSAKIGETAIIYPPQALVEHGVRNRRRGAATEAGAQERSPEGPRGCIEPRKSLQAVAARNSGRWGGTGGQAPSGPCDPCGRTFLLSRVTLFAFSVIATLPTMTRPQIPEDTNADCHL